MWTQATRWVGVVLLASLTSAAGCARARADESARVRPPERQPIVADDSLMYAFDTRLETRLQDRLDLDNFLRDRLIYLDVADGAVRLTGEVWTPLEKQRAALLIRQVPGVIDVVNDLDVRPPE